MSWSGQDETEWAELHNYYDSGPMVCIAHKRFIPCRADDGLCAFSEDVEDVAAVTAYQRSEE